jgi:hypothetical protein
MTDNSHQKRGVIRSYIVPLLPLVIGLFLIIILLVLNARFTVISGEKTDDLGYYSYGYKVEQYYVRNSSRLTFWSSRGMKFVCDLGPLTVDEVAEQRWIKNDAAIYLNLQIRYHDSLVSVSPARIIYDFHRGEIHTYSGYTLWRSFDKRHKGEDWMSDAEFDAVLSRLEQSGQETQ